MDCGWLDELVAFISLVRGFQRRDGIGGVEWGLTALQQVVGALDAIPALISIHRVVATDDGGDVADAQGGEPVLDTLHYHIDDARFSVGDFELSYRMHHRAGRAIKAVLEGAVDEAVRAREAGESSVIAFNLSGHGHFDMAAYDSYFDNKLEDYELPQAQIDAALKNLPVIGA